MLRSAIRPLLDVAHVTQRSQNSRARGAAAGDGHHPAAVGAVVPQPQHAAQRQVGQPDAARPGGVRVHRVLVPGAVRPARPGPLAARLGVQRRVGQPEEVLGLLAGLVPDRRAGDRIGHVAAHHGRRGRMPGPVGRLGSRGNHRVQVAVLAHADHVDEVAGLELGEADLDPAGRLGRDAHDPAPLSPGPRRPAARPGRPAARWCRSRGRPGPRCVHHGPAGVLAPDDGLVPPPQGGRRDRRAPPGLPVRRQREPLLAVPGPQDQDVRADVQDRAADGIPQGPRPRPLRSPRADVLALLAGPGRRP